MSIDITEYKELYVKTARELIAVMKKTLDDLQNNPKDPKALADFHRAAHSLKSQSLVMGYTQIGVATRLLETLFLPIKDNKTEYDENLAKEVPLIVTRLEESLENIGLHDGELDLNPVVQKLQNLTNSCFI